MAGMKVVVVSTGEDGSLDMADLAAKIDQNRDQLAALMKADVGRYTKVIKAANITIEN